MNSTTLKLRRTGKIALLFTIICIAMLNGMTPQNRQPGHYGLGVGIVPSEVQNIINAYDNAEDAILAIRTDILLGDQELKRMVTDEFEFNKLVHTLADKFNLSTNKIAHKFKTPVAEQYINLGNKLIYVVSQYSQYEKFSKNSIKFKEYIKEIINLISQGADINYSTDGHTTPLMIAMKVKVDSAFIQFLLDVGADPSLTDSHGLSALDYVFTYYTFPPHPQKAEIKAMLKKAMK